METPLSIIPPDPLILVVDDEAANRDFLAHVLARELPQARLVQARNGRLALEEIARELPDLILLDLAMPELDGYAVLDKLQEQDETRHVPVIVLTSYGLQDTELDTIGAGADDFIAKPFRGMEVFTRVQALLRVRFRYRALQDRILELADENRLLRSWLEEHIGIEEVRGLYTRR